MVHTGFKPPFAVTDEAKTPAGRVMLKRTFSALSVLATLFRLLSLKMVAMY